MLRLLLSLATTFMFTGAAAAGQEPASPRVASAVSQCEVSIDPDYGYSPKRAVQVGGGPMYLASRERRFLDALRGPTGGPIKYKRLGQHPLSPPNSLIILDAYEVTYDGLEKPLVLYLDGYRFDDAMKAPVGFTCGAAIPLGDPGPDAFEAMDSLVKVALQDTRSADLPGIPLDAAGTSSAGIAFDQYRLIARLAKAAATAGKPVAYNPNARRPDSLRERTVVIALPRTCAGQVARATSIDLEVRFDNGQRAPATRQGDYTTGEALSALVPGYEPPPSAVAAIFSLATLRANETIRIVYAEPCVASDSSVVHVKYTPAQLLKSPSPVLPVGAPASQPAVRLQVTIDLDGSFQAPTYKGGAEHLFEAASQGVQTTWKAEPARINGAPISTPVTLYVKFVPKE